MDTELWSLRSEHIRVDAQSSLVRTDRQFTNSHQTTDVAKITLFAPPHAKETKCFAISRFAGQVECENHCWFLAFLFVCDLRIAQKCRNRQTPLKPDNFIVRQNLLLSLEHDRELFDFGSLRLKSDLVFI